MAKKSKSKTRVKKAKRSPSPKAIAKTKKSKAATKAKTPKRKKKTAPTKKRKGPHVIFEGTRKPKYACVYTSIDGVCIRFELNQNSGEYDLNPTKVPCDTCDHFIPPTG